MPYTLAHPALVVPLRRWCVLGALVAGSMAPDTAYYLPASADWLILWPGTDTTHTVIGAIGYDALLGLLLYAVWRWPLRPAVLGALPEPWGGAALEGTRSVLPGRSRPMALLLLYASAAIGALTHVVLDTLTHDRPDTPSVLVDDTILGLPIAAQLQRWLSVVGLALLVWWAWRWLSSIAPTSGLRPTRECVLLVGAAAVGAVAVGGLHLATTPLESRGDALVQALVGVTAGAVLGLLIGSCAVVLRRRALADRGAR